MMSNSTRRTLVLLLIMGAVVFASHAMAAKERSNEVVSAIVPFEAGQVVPDLEHNIIKFRSLDIILGDPDAEKNKQKVKLKMKVENFGALRGLDRMDSAGRHSPRMFTGPWMPVSWRFLTGC